MPTGDVARSGLGQRMGLAGGAREGLGRERGGPWPGPWDTLGLVQGGGSRSWLQVQHQHVEGFDRLLDLLLGGCPWELREARHGGLCQRLGTRPTEPQTLQVGSFLLARRRTRLLLLLLLLPGTEAPLHSLPAASPAGWSWGQLGLSVREGLRAEHTAGVMAIVGGGH